jgi:hypothetical protein
LRGGEAEYAATRWAMKNCDVDEATKDGWWVERRREGRRQGKS